MWGRNFSILFTRISMSIMSDFCIATEILNPHPEFPGLRFKIFARSRLSIGQALILNILSIHPTLLTSN
jgi:hypothetical protein